MNQVFVKLPVKQKRESILNRMEVLHDRIIEAQERLSFQNQKHQRKKLNVQNNILNLIIHPQSAKISYSTIGTQTKLEDNMPTTCSQNYSQHASLLADAPFDKSYSNKYYTSRRLIVSQPIIQDKENNSNSIVDKCSFQSPEKRNHKNKSMFNPSKNDSPVKSLIKELALNLSDQNLLEEGKEDYIQTIFYPLQIVNQNSLNFIQRDNTSNKKDSLGSISSGSKQQYLFTHPRFKISNKYLDLSGCQWQSAYIEQQQVNDFDESQKNNLCLKQISFVPSIFQKKAIRPKKKKANKLYVQISSDIRDRVANMIKQRLRFNQELRENNKKSRGLKQSSQTFLQTADLQKKLKQGLVKKAFLMNDPKRNK